MAIYSFPVSGTTAVTIASGADFATQTTLAQLYTRVNTLTLNSGAADANTLRTVLATRHEAATTPLAVRLTDGTNFFTNKPEYAKAIAPVLHNFATTGITAAAYTQIIASTSAKAIIWQFSNTSGSHITIATGAGGAEAPFAIIPPGGAAEISISIAASTRISVTSDDSVASGKFTISAFI